MTWRDIAEKYPNFVQWIVQRYGPLPDGPAKESDYNRFKKDYESEVGC